MSGFPAALRKVGLVEHAPRTCRHRKLSPEMLVLFLVEARKHAELMEYDELARRSKLSRGTVRGLMATLIREARAGVVRDRRGNAKRGTNLSQLAEELRESVEA